MLVFNIRYVFDNLFTQFWLSIFFFLQRIEFYTHWLFLIVKSTFAISFLRSTRRTMNGISYNAGLIPLKTDGDLVVN